MKLSVFIVYLCFIFCGCTVSNNSEEGSSEDSSTINYMEGDADEDALGSQDHLTFKGVPIDGSLKHFIKKMENVGFEYIGDNKGVAILKGDFAGYKNCIIGVTTLQNIDIVNTIGVVFPKCSEWVGLEQNYNSLKNMLIQKYGNPAEVVEKFEGIGPVVDSNDKYYKLQMNQCTWYSLFETIKGNILLSIKNTDFDTYVLLNYFDKINSEIVQSAAMDDL